LIPSCPHGWVSPSHPLRSGTAKAAAKSGQSSGTLNPAEVTRRPLAWPRSSLCGRVASGSVRVGWIEARRQGTRRQANGVPPFFAPTVGAVYGVEGEIALRVRLGHPPL
jgi:hypothetical protein